MAFGISGISRWVVVRSIVNSNLIRSRVMRVMGGRINFSSLSSNCVRGKLVPKCVRPHTKRDQTKLYSSRVENFLRKSFASLSGTSSTCPTPFSIGFQRMGQRLYGLSIAVGATVLYNSREERVESLLQMNPDDRTVAQKLELFNLLLELGRDEARKASGRDVVIVFGNTGGGKSTLINFASGCKMKKEEGGDIIVDPDSEVGEVSQIGADTVSCTAIPKVVPDILFTAKATPDTDGQHTLTLFDMPGRADNRGIEVSLANAMILQEIMRVSNSVRFVLVFEDGQISAERGAKWREAVELLKENFSGLLGEGTNSLCLVITKTQDPLETIKKKIQKNSKDVTNLSQYAFVYNPLDSTDRQRFLSVVHQTRSHTSIDSRIAVGAHQLWDALELGKQIQASVASDLNNKEDHSAMQKVRFTHRLANLNNPGLKEPHEKASKAVLDSAQDVLRRVNPYSKVGKNNLTAFKRYKDLRTTFIPYVDFDETDVELNKILKYCEDPRAIAWNEGETFIASIAATTVAAACGCGLKESGASTSWLAAAVLLTVGGSCCVVKAGWNWWIPAEKDKEMSEFFAGV